MQCSTQRVSKAVIRTQHHQATHLTAKNTYIIAKIRVVKYSLLNKNQKIAQKCFGSRTWVHKKTIWSSSCIPAFNQNKNGLKIKTICVICVKMKFFNIKKWKSKKNVLFLLVLLIIEKIKYKTNVYSLK